MVALLMFVMFPFILFYFFLSAWRFPAKWPFPAEYTELVPAESTIFTKMNSPTVNVALRNHFSNFIDDANSVLELSCISEPILRETGIEKLTHLEITPININETIFSLPFATATFDRVVIAAGIEYIHQPCELFREIWRVLKPSGLCFVAFLDKPIDINTDATLNPLKMWTTMTEEQKIWIAGRYHSTHQLSYVTLHLIFILSFLFKYLLQLL